MHDRTSSHTNRRIAVLWRGDPNAPDAPVSYEARLAPVIAALNAAGFAGEGVVWFDERAGEIEAHLARMAGVLVWINPLAQGRDRSIVDATLRRIASAGTWVSTHPDVTAQMGTKEVLYTTRHLGWGADTDLYADMAAFEARLWPRLDAGAVRVLKPLRGNDGQGVMKVARDGEALSVQHAGDDRVERMPRNALTAHIRETLTRGPVIDQPFNDNAAAGMVRCYVSQNRVVGFAEQQPRQAGRGAFAMNAAKAMHNADAPAFANLRQAMEQDWIPAMQRTLSLSAAQLPAIWDADFLHRGPTNEPDRHPFVLCEINVSCVSPFPPAAPEAIAEAVTRCVARSRAGDV